MVIAPCSTDRHFHSSTKPFSGLNTYLDAWDVLFRNELRFENCQCIAGGEQYDGVLKLVTLVDPAVYSDGIKYSRTVREPIMSKPTSSRNRKRLANSHLGTHLTVPTLGVKTQAESSPARTNGGTFWVRLVLFACDWNARLVSGGRRATNISATTQ